MLFRDTYKSCLKEEEINEALKTLKRNDVVSETEVSWKIIVPLFRQWVVNNQI